MITGDGVLRVMSSAGLKPNIGFWSYQIKSLRPLDQNHFQYIFNVLSTDSKWVTLFHWVFSFFFLLFFFSPNFSQLNYCQFPVTICPTTSNFSYIPMTDTQFLPRQEYSTCLEMGSLGFMVIDIYVYYHQGQNSLLLHSPLYSPLHPSSCTQANLLSLFSAVLHWSQCTCLEQKIETSSKCFATVCQLSHRKNKSIAWGVIQRQYSADCITAFKAVLQ